MDGFEGLTKYLHRQTSAALLAEYVLFYGCKCANIVFSSISLKEAKINKRRVIHSP
jgi:hypothetical protein